MKKNNIEQEISKNNQDLVTLAVKCKLINNDQENEVLTRLFQDLKKHSGNDCSVINIFKEQGILSQEDIDFLLSIKKHLEIKSLDKKFARLAIANNFISPDVIKEMFNRQTALFKKTGKTMPLGDILVKNQNMSEADRTALLLTQDRIKDEYLADAMNKLTVTEFEKRAINKKFGSIAVKNNFISMNKINEALKIQIKENNNNLAPRYLGDILEKSFGLPHETTLEILKEQKIYEKRRLNLEKALYQYNSEIKTNQVLSKTFDHYVSLDKLKAYVRINRNFSEKITVHLLLNWIKLMGIQFGLVDDTTIANFLADKAERSTLKIAKGIPAQEGTSASMEFYFNTDSDKDCSFVKKKTVLAKRIPHIEGIPGKNVFGQTIFPQKIDIRPLRIGKGVTEKNHTFIAEIDGTPVLCQQRTLFIRPLTQNIKTINISGDLSPEAEKAYKTSNLVVNGSILQKTRLKCHQLEVNGSILGDMDIKATGDVVIKGRVEGKPANENNPDFQLTIVSEGNISVSKEVKNARVMSNKTFRAINANIVSSFVSAYQGIFIKNVYSDKTRPAVLQIGRKLDSGLKDLQAEIDKKNKELRALKRLDVLEKMEEMLHLQIQVQDDYREKQNVLTYLSKIIGETKLEEFDTRETNFDFFKTEKKAVE